MPNEYDILNDKSIPDELEIPIGDRKIKLGDLRALTAKQQRDLAEKLADAEARQKSALEMSEKATGIYNTLAKLEAEATAAKAKQPTGDEDDFETNNWWTPVRKRLSERDKKLEEVANKFQTLSDAFTKAATMFATDRWNSQYDRVAPKLKKSKDYADWDVVKVREYATKNNILDEFGFPSVEKAVSFLTRVDDIEEAKKQAREEGLREGLQRARLNSQSRPTSATGKAPQKGKSVVEEMGLEGLGDDVMADDEIAEMLEKTQAAFDPSQLQ
jgi:hypothetical protein